LDIEELKKDIEIFGKGVERLEQLKAEFKQIDTSGNKEKADEIRSMLKNVSAIPQLEVKIANLKDTNEQAQNKAPSEIEKITADIKKNNLKYLKDKENLIRAEAEANLQRAEELLKTKNELEMQHKIKTLEFNNIDYLKKLEVELRVEINNKLEKEFYEKLQDRGKQIRKDLEDEFNKKLNESKIKQVPKASQTKKPQEEDK